jgi:hypothetical protein
MVFVRCGLRGANDRKEKFAMAYYDSLQQNPMHSQFNPQQWAQFNPQQAWSPPWGTMQGMGAGPGQASYGQQYGQFGGQPFIGAYGHNQGWGVQPQWWGQGQHRQLSQHDVSEVVRQLLPALPQILAQAQQPYALGYAAYGQTPYGYGQGPRTLSPHDVNEVVRQILPFVPQIVTTLQGQPLPQHAAFHGGFGQNVGQQWGQNPLAGWMQPQQQFGQYGSPQMQAAFGASSVWGPQRPLTQQDVADVTRQLVGLIPQVIGNLQAYNQQRMI